MAQLSFGKQVAYGMAGLSTVLPDLIMMQWLMVRYVPPNADPLIPGVLFGAFVLCGRMTEGISCPIVGHWSDTSTHRWGRRMPFMRLGIVPYLLIFFLIFNPPASMPQWLRIPYAFVLFEAYFFLYTAIFTPYLALLPEISSDLKERVDLMTVQAVFVMVGTFVFAGMGEMLNRWGWAVAIGCATTLIALFFVPVSTRISEKFRVTEQAATLRLWESIRLTLHNRPFRYLLASTSCYFYALNGMLLILPYWAVSYLGGSEGDVTRLMVPYLFVSLGFFFVFNALAPRFGKYALLLATFIGTGVVMGALILVGHLPFGTPFVQSAVLMALMGAPMAGFMVLPYAVLSDVIDYDERLTGRRREAVYFGVQGVAQKAMIGLSVLTFSFLRYLGTTSDALAPLSLKLMAVLCGGACIVGALIFWRYPIRERGGRIAFVSAPWGDQD